jgi:selenocysteine-specific elongation factor
MIVATAGHVDHGKTLLVQALTGIDADRLPEEKRRGMTIDLGFAYLPVGGEAIGFIDVPGHERFIHNMLCGVTGIDLVLFILAADDGPMPQSLEHLAILDLLEVSRGVVALTKIDRVAPSRLREAAGELSVMLAGTSLEKAPVFPVSALTGEGVEALKDHLVRAAHDCPPRPTNGNFRLAIDRCFSLKGAGLIVTGTAVSGQVAAGDHVRLLKTATAARVRSIHAQNRASENGRAGQRCALNLSGPGLNHDLIERGDWVVTGGVPEPVTKIDARLRVLKTEAEAMEHWTAVHVHLGAADVTGRVAILGADQIPPGGSGLVQLVLDRPTGAVRGDRFILRDQSARRTLGGGSVIDIFPPGRGRARPERLAYLAAMQDPDTLAALVSLLLYAPNGLDLSKFAANRNLTAKEATQLLSEAGVHIVANPAGEMGFSHARWAELKSQALNAIRSIHRREPNQTSVAEDRLLNDGRSAARELAAAIAADLVREGKLIREPSGVRLPEHMPAMSAADTALWKKIAPLMDANRLRPPAVHELAVAVAENPQKMEAFLVRASKFGLIVRVAPNRFFLAGALLDLGKIAEQEAAKQPARQLTLPAFRDRSGVGRTVAVEILEYFDRVKFTRRVGDARQVIRPASEVFATR